jgi:superfamily I DNA and/or RNA helicase
MEADAVVRQAVQALSNAAMKVVWVITFYNKQKQEISKLAESYPELVSATEQKRFAVVSVDSCQGSEADVVLISTVRTSGISSFMTDTRRLCVALSRAKYEAVIVGSLANFKGGICKSNATWEGIADHYSANA